MENERRKKIRRRKERKMERREKIRRRKERKMERGERERVRGGHPQSTLTKGWMGEGGVSLIDGDKGDLRLAVLNDFFQP